jgi:hypothetical protein
MLEILPSNLNFTSLLHWKNFLMESLITFYLFSYCALDPLWTSSSLAFQILPLNPNFISFLHWKKCLNGEFDRTLFYFEKKTKIHILTQSCRFVKPPHCKNGA